MSAQRRFALLIFMPFMAVDVIYFRVIFPPFQEDIFSIFIFRLFLGEVNNRFDVCFRRNDELWMLGHCLEEAQEEKEYTEQTFQMTLRLREKVFRSMNISGKQAIVLPGSKPADGLGFSQV